MFRWFLPTVVAVLVGVLILLGYLLPLPALVPVRDVLVEGATLLAAFAMLVAYVNLLRVHVRRFTDKDARHRLASLILLISAVGTLLLVAIQGPDSVMSRSLVNYVLVPGESALLALTAVTLVLAGMRLLSTRRHVGSVLFVVVVLFTLFSALPFVYPQVLLIIRSLIDSIATAGMRGLLLGVVLGIVLTGLRIILGIDRPQSGG